MDGDRSVDGARRPESYSSQALRAPATAGAGYEMNFGDLEKDVNRREGAGPRSAVPEEPSSILGVVGLQYAAGAADSSCEPAEGAAGVGRGVSQYLRGKFSRKPATARQHSDESMVHHDSCSLIKQNLKKQAEDYRARQSAMARASEAEADKSSRSYVLNAGDSVSTKGSNTSCKSSMTTGTSFSLGSTFKRAPSESSRDNSLEIETASTATSTNISADLVTSGWGHYEPNNDVILRLETLSSSELRVLNFTLLLWLGVASAFLGFQFIYKIVNPYGALHSFDAVIINSVFSSICFSAMGAALIVHLHRIYETYKSKRVWKPRRLQYTLLVTIELIAQWINSIFYMVPNFASYGPTCFKIPDSANIGYYSLIRWTCWNTVFLMSLIHAHNACIATQAGGLSDLPKCLAAVRLSYCNACAEQVRMIPTGRSSIAKRSSLRSTQKQQVDVAVMDLPFMQTHWPKLLFWLLTEGSVLLCTLYYTSTIDHKAFKDDPQIDPRNGHVSCAVDGANCRIGNKILGFCSIMVFLILVYFVMYCYHIGRALKQLHSRSATDNKLANVVVRLQMRLRLPAFAFFALSVLLLWYIKPFSCDSLINTWYGMLPGQLAATVSILLLVFVGTPKANGDHKPILKVWLQEFAWTEAEKPGKIQRRSRSLPEDQHHELENEPMYCVETMMNLLYWSLLAYDHGEMTGSKLSVEQGCGLFQPPLEEFELWSDKGLDTRMLLAWNSEQMVVSFRGTASMNNVLADLQAWRTPHEPVRGNIWTRPRVHAGFDKAWRNNKFSKKVITRIGEVFKSAAANNRQLRFYVTGHSLGGALATLAAYDMQACAREQGYDALVSCYTFGAPRTGNHAFAADFERMVPDCWHIINDQDIVARGAKFWLYKRGGHRVLINRMGDLIVRPTLIESSTRLVPCVFLSGSIQQHLLTSYLDTLLGVMLAQFKAKFTHGGMKGVIDLIKDNEALKTLLLDRTELTFEDMIRVAKWGPEYAGKFTKARGKKVTLRKGTATRRSSDSRALSGDTQSTTRGVPSCMCCAPMTVWIKDVTGGKDRDANVFDGGNMDDSDSEDLDKLSAEPQSGNAGSLSGPDKTEAAEMAAAAEDMV